MFVCLFVRLLEENEVIKPLISIFSRNNNQTLNDLYSLPDFSDKPELFEETINQMSLPNTRTDNNQNNRNNNIELNDNFMNENEIENENENETDGNDVNMHTRTDGSTNEVNSDYQKLLNRLRLLTSNHNYNSNNNATNNHNSNSNMDLNTNLNTNSHTNSHTNTHTNTNNDTSSHKTIKLCRKYIEKIYYQIELSHENWLENEIMKRHLYEIVASQHSQLVYPLSKQALPLFSMIPIELLNINLSPINNYYIKNPLNSINNSNNSINNENENSEWEIMTDIRYPNAMNNPTSTSMNASFLSNNNNSKTNIYFHKKTGRYQLTEPFDISMKKETSELTVIPWYVCTSVRTSVRLSVHLSVCLSVL